MTLLYFHKATLLFLTTAMLLWACDREPQYEEMQLSITKTPADNKMDAFNLYFLNDTFGFAYGRKPFYMTKNGGKSWQNSQIDNDLQVLSIGFADVNNGYISCTKENSIQGVVLKTTDGGEHWQKTNTNVPVNGYNGYDNLLFFDDIYALNANNVFFTASFGSIDVSWLAKSFDGGNKWIYEKTIDVHQLSFINTKIGYANGWGGIIKTQDGGKDWYVVSRDACFDLVMLNEKEGYQVDITVLMKTEDGGKTWNKTSVNWLGISWFGFGEHASISYFKQLNEKQLIFCYFNRIIKFSTDITHCYKFELPYNFEGLFVYTDNRAKVLVNNELWDITFQ